MFQTEEQIKRLATLTGVMLMVAAEALAQDKQQPVRRIVVTIGFTMAVSLFVRR